MASSAASTAVPFIYIIGVPAAGKTTLIEDLAKRLRQDEPQRNLTVIPEVARELVSSAKLNPRDIQAGNKRAMDLQRRILSAQMAREEAAANTADFVLSDRSGVDPIAFATKYGGVLHGQALLDLAAWGVLQRRMQRGFVILCEPMPQWFVDDGVRVVPASATELSELHDTFCAVLTSQAIPFKILPTSAVEKEERLELVLRYLREQGN